MQVFNAEKEGLPEKMSNCSRRSSISYFNARTHKDYIVTVASDLWSSRRGLNLNTSAGMCNVAMNKSGLHTHLPTKCI